MIARSWMIALLISKQGRLAGEDSRHTWTITIESFMGERNKIKRANSIYERENGLVKAVFSCMSLPEWVIHDVLLTFPIINATIDN
jgi:hypothetical protein